MARRRSTSGLIAGLVTAAALLSGCATVIDGAASPMAGSAPTEEQQSQETDPAPEDDPGGSDKPTDAPSEDSGDAGDGDATNALCARLDAAAVAGLLGVPDVAVTFTESPTPSCTFTNAVTGAPVVALNDIAAVTVGQTMAQICTQTAQSLAGSSERALTGIGTVAWVVPGWDAARPRAVAAVEHNGARFTVVAAAPVPGDGSPAELDAYAELATSLLRALTIG